MTPELAKFAVRARRLWEANAQTESRMIYIAACGIEGDHTGRRAEAMVERMERKHAERRNEIRDLACQTVTGMRWNEWIKSLGAGPANGYTPSLDGGRYGDVAKVLAACWKERFGTEAYLY